MKLYEIINFFFGKKLADEFYAGKLNRHFEEIKKGGLKVLYRKICSAIIVLLRRGIFHKAFVNPGFLNLKVYILYFKYIQRRVPFRQVASLDSFLKFSRILDETGIEFFLRGGTLLGAVRQGAFAGRPGDIDLLIREEDLESLLELKPFLHKKGYRVRVNPSKSIVAIFPLRGCGIPMVCYELVNLDSYGYRVYFPKTAKPFNENKKIFKTGEMPIEENKLSSPDIAYIFDYAFKIPNNPEEILLKDYGPGWEIPDSPQYAWRK